MKNNKNGNNGTTTIDFTKIKEEAAQLAVEPPITSALRIQSADAWLNEAKGQPIPKQLFDEFWYESELCFLFADTNAGKSILAMQISERIASGKSEADAQKVLYFDFELSAKQFERRYSQNYENHYKFSDNLYRVQINLNAERPERYKDFPEWLDASFNYALAETEARIVIVDNVTYMRSELEKSHIAAEMMQTLNNLKNKIGLSILALGHTPKRDGTRPLSINDLGGSKMLANFADSTFAIGKSFKDDNLRYLKQIKTRSGPFKHGDENVVVMEIAKDTNFLEFQPKGFSNEKDHLKTLTDKEREELPANIRNLKARGFNQREIAHQLGISLGKVNQVLKDKQKSC